MTTTRLWLFVASTVLLAGCSDLAYYAQATKGQLEIVAKREPIRDLIDDPDIEDSLRSRLILVNRIRDFASSHLGLPDNRSYRYYTDLERSHVVWNVVATGKFSLEPITWCFPVAGCVAYKGYFSKAKSEMLNETLVDQGYDTFFYGVTAYSTLGWFADPVLNTFIHYDELSLAGLIFHELAHQVVYIQDDSAFNEAFATAVEVEGIRHWLEANQSEGAFQSYLDLQARHQAITAMVLSYRDQLATVYSESLMETDEQRSALSERKRAIFSAMGAQYLTMSQTGQGTRYYDWWFDLPLNNAHLISVATYHEWVPAFTKLIERADDFPSFFQSVKRLGDMDPAQRQAELRVLLDE